MKTLRIDLSKDFSDIRDVLPGERGRSVALGYFDGVHRGHQELVRQLLYRAEILGLESTVFSFDRYPKPVPPYTHLNATVPGQDSPSHYLLESPLPPVDYPFKGLLQSDAQRDCVFESLGVELLILQEFNKSFAGMSAEEFLEKIIYQKLNAKVVIVGDGYRFAANQSGDVELLKQFCAKHEMELYVVPPLYADGEIVSSTRIRNCVQNGNMQLAEKLLGSPFKIPGRVIHGKALGRTVGMPTANFRIPTGMVVPAYGVYVSRTQIAGRHYDSITNIGLRPTVNHTDPMPLVETLILDRIFDIYNQDIEVEFLEFMRPEERFPSFIAMSNQIAFDLEFARNWHKNSDNNYLYSNVRGIPVYVSRSDRFNTSYISVDFFTPLEKEASSENALLARVLTAVSREYPTRPELQSFLDTQYGAVIASGTSAINNLQRVNFSLSAVHHGLDGSTPFENGLGVFLDMLFQPAKDEEGKWFSSIVESERMNLLMGLRAEANDKSISVYNRALELLRPNAYPWVNPGGKMENVEKIDANALERAWLRLVSESQIRIFVGGNFDDTVKMDEIVARLEKLPRHNNALHLVPGRIPKSINYENRGRVVERHNVELAHLVMIYDGMPPYSSIRCQGATIINEMFGGSQQSLLYQSVREEMGLAYYVESVYDCFAQTITVIAEVNPDDVVEVAKCVTACLNRLQKGEYPENLFEVAKTSARNEFLQISDDREADLDALSIELLAGREFNGEEFSSFQDSLEQNQLQQIAKSMCLKLTYLSLPLEAEPHAWEEK